MIAVILAAISMVIIPPDLNYIFYIDFRTLGILFCLMAVVAGMKQIHVFDRLAQGLLAQVRGSGGIVLTLVLLCFFLSMLITNDVALITFVPFTIIIMKQLGEKVQRTWMLRVVVMQTIAANLGSMLTPIGNPQNLYLYGKAGIGIPGFLRLMLPYTGISLLLLGVWIAICVGREKFEKGDVTEGKTLITEKNQERALELYYDLLTLKEPPMRILFLLAKQYRQLLQVKQFGAAGLAQTEMASKLGVPTFAVRNIVSCARAYSISELEQAVRDFVDAEESVKTGRLEDKLSVELLIIKYSSKTAVKKA